MGSKQTIRVLLVEDDDEDSFLLQDMLHDAAAAAFSVVRVSRLTQALTQLTQLTFDVVLLDLILPDSTGLETLVALRAHAVRVPIVILSGLEDEDFKMQTVQAGAQDYLAKGQLTPNGLVRALRYAIQRKRSEEALQASEERFRSAFDYAATGMGLVSQTGYWLRVNRSLCEILGHTEQELLTRTFISSIHPGDMASHAQYVHKLLSGELRYYQVENRIIHKSGNTKWVLLSVSLVRDAQGGLPYSIFQLQDITRAKEAEESLRFLAEEAEERSRLLTIDQVERQNRMQGYYSGPVAALGNCKEALDWARQQSANGRALSLAELKYLYDTLSTNQEKILAAMQL